MFIPLTLSDEQRALEAVVRELVEDRSDLGCVLRGDPAYDFRIWRFMAEMGLPGLAVPAEHGGAGGGATELLVAGRQVGRRLLASPYFATAVLAASFIGEAASPVARADLLPRIATGKCTATVALGAAPVSGRLFDAAAVTAVASDDGYRLSGRVRFVPDGGTADLVLVVARLDGASAVFAVEHGARGLAIADLTVLDLTRPQADLAFAETPARLVANGPWLEAAGQRALNRSVLGLVAEQLGAAEYLLEAAVDYAKLRHQFGRPIGSFQAVKHKLADIAVDVERMAAAAWQTAQALDAGRNDASAVASVAKAFCSEAFVRVATENIQIHGGIGFTWEHPAHLYFRRATSDTALLGTPAEHRARLFDQLTAHLNGAVTS